MKNQRLRSFLLLSLLACTAFGGCGSTNRAAPVIDLSPAPVITTPIESRAVDSPKQVAKTRKTIPKKPEATSTVATAKSTSSEAREKRAKTVAATPSSNVALKNKPATQEQPRQTPAVRTQSPAIVKPYREGDWRPEYYSVQQGDTLYSIALEFGQAYQDLATWNHLADPTYIQIGQQLRLFPKDGQAGTATSEPVALPPASLPNSNQAANAVVEIPLFSDPKVYRAEYSTQALAEIRRAVSGEVTTTVIPTKTAAIATPSAATKKPEPIKSVQAGRAALPDERLNWEWPAPGEVIYKFAQGPNKKGVVIRGEPGQAIVSSAAGKVVYSGSGLRGYGNLLIIKHNATYLSVYAHNKQLLVREGQSVAQGQKIAVMGNASGQPTALHFEIRRLGKPIDPLKQLPGRPS